MLLANMIIKGGDEQDVVCAAREGLGLGAVHENPEEEEEDDHVEEEVLDVEDLELEVVHGDGVVVGGEGLQVVEGHSSFSYIILLCLFFLFFYTLWQSV